MRPFYRCPGLPVLLMAACVAAACSSPRPPEPANYVDRVAAARVAKDNDLRNGEDGQPMPKNKRDEFLPLAYFAIDQEYRVPASFNPIDDPTILNVPTSTGTNRQMRRAGRLEFTLKAHSLSLTAYNEVGGDRDSLFVPFRDLTSGTETYVAGRYLDLHRNATGLYEVDFNLAYNPYCYYNPTYECPYPPPENRLTTPIRAGERLKVANR